MVKTEMLYMQDNYIRSFTATVIAKGESYIVLNQTAFYPEGGGQECDIGTLSYKDTTLTINKVLRESGEVKHFITEIDKIPDIGEIVKCELDWDRRFIHMRYHTAIHILSTYMKEKFNAEVVGNNISTRNGRVDFDLEKALTDNQLKSIENGVNEIIAQNLPICINFMPREEAKKFLEEKGYQIDYIEMVPKSVKIFRIISVGEYDHASCAGTHVNNSKEIGKILIIKRRSIGVRKERIVLALE
ncbi:MAG: alanyl-tRNA editing protein [Candidatus Heimdallarchaeota archaeon]|nr:alanyl-tRNA editing protein [Candidatus Heimdallarchaeota archaeon]